MPERKWKYNPKVLQHWLETDESGELSYTERDAIIDNAEVDLSDHPAAGMPPLLSLESHGAGLSNLLPPADGGVEGEAHAIHEPEHLVQ